MKLTKKTGILIGTLLLITALVVWRDISYWKEFRAFKATIREHNLRIVGTWEYEEDLVLEDYGVKVATGTSEFWIDSRYPTRLQKSDDPIVGIWIQHEEDGSQSRAFAVDSQFWKEADLPMITTFGDFLRHADAIIPKLRNAQAPLFSYHEGVSERLRRYLIIRFNDRPGNPGQTLRH